MTQPMMTTYFRDDQPLPEDFPWASWAEFRKEMEATWEEMKQKGVDLGHLEVTEEGWLKGSGHPDAWFDSLEDVDLK